MNLAIMLPNWLGDAAMATPTLRALRKQFPAPARLVGVMRPYVKELLAGTPWLDELLFYQPKSHHAEHSAWTLVRELRRRRLDAMVLLTNSFRTAGLAWLGGARRRIGYARNCRGMLLTDPLYPPRAGKHVSAVSSVDYYLELAYYLGCPPESRRLELATLPADERAADDVWERLGLAKARRVAVFNTGGAFGAARRWPSEHCAALARRVAEELDATALVICGPKEREAAAETARLANHPRVMSMADESMALGLSKACIRRADVMVSTDSGPRHIAAAFDVPTVALYGSTHPAWNHNYNPRAVDLNLSLPCSPCNRRVCPLQHHRCMRDLTPDAVFAAVARLLTQETQRQRRAG
jgi:heptosyltransferase-2